MSLIEMRRLTKRYRTGRSATWALRGIDLDIEEREFLAIWGPSGSGKTSLLNLIGLIDVPTAGELTVAGQKSAALGDSELAALRSRLIGFVFQNFNLVPVLSALENVMLPLLIRGEPARAARRKAMEKLEQVGLATLSNSRPDQMSGGQKQRMAIARALVTQPAIVLADEPTANLDTETSYQIAALMRDLNIADGVTFLFATHDPRLLERVSRHIRMEDGVVVKQEVNDVFLHHRATEHP